MKRLAEQFRKNSKQPGMAEFFGPYTYKSYESYLYGKKCSFSNKILSNFELHELEETIGKNRRKSNDQTLFFLPSRPTPQADAIKRRKSASATTQCPLKSYICVKIASHSVVLVAIGQCDRESFQTFQTFHSELASIQTLDSKVHLKPISRIACKYIVDDSLTHDHPHHYARHTFKPKHAQNES